MVLESVESFWELASNDRFLKMKGFALKMHSMFGNTYVCEHIFSREVKSRNRSRMADETFGRYSPTCYQLILGLTKERVSEKPRSHW